MENGESTQSLVKVTHSDVALWFRNAWPGRDADPDGIKAIQLANVINLIVDAENAHPKRKGSFEALVRRRANDVAARRKAKALKDALLLVANDLEFTSQAITNGYGDMLLPQDLIDQISIVESAQRAVQDFLDLGAPPKAREKGDPILWIADAVEKIWSNYPSSKISFGHKADSSFVWFIRLVLEGIGLAAEDRPGYSLDTISEHLRGRQNRPRERRSKTSGGGKLDPKAPREHTAE